MRTPIGRAGLDPEAREGAADIMMKLYECYIDGDADLVEINPLVLTTDGEVRVLDAKVTLDDDAAFRHPEWAEMDNFGESTERERFAKSKGLSYIALDGSVGIIANGAGLAMSTVDVVSQVGGAAANFLDVGGGADADGMAAALEVINLDPSVRSILVNIFGGIVRCDDVARGIVQALEQVDIASQIVLRLDGTNAKEAHRIIATKRPRRRSSARRPCSAPCTCGRDRGRAPVEKEVRSCEHLRRRERPEVVVQGLTGSQGRFHGLRNRADGTKVVAGVTPWEGRPGRRGHPDLRLGRRGRGRHWGDGELHSRAALGAPGAILDAAEAGIRVVVCITEHIPAKDEALINARLTRDFPDVRLIGPNCPGIISPGKCNIGITSGDIALPGGPVGVVSRSGTLDVPGPPRVVATGRRPDHLRRHRGRPGAGIELRRCAHRFPGGPGDPAPST